MEGKVYLEVQGKKRITMEITKEGRVLGVKRLWITMEGKLGKSCQFKVLHINLLTE